MLTDGTRIMIFQKTTPSSSIFYNSGSPDPFPNNCEDASTSHQFHPCFIGVHPLAK
jgi:hypothetical protein